MFACPECGLLQAQSGPCPSDGTPLVPRGDDILLGTTLGAYRVARLLGVGGMGRVYKGAHPQIGSRVAIKVLSFECAQRQDLVERFFSEARAVNLIRHESIVNVLDLATLPDGRPYIIMEYLDGAALAAIVEQAGALPLGSLARLTAEVLDALGAAHSKGIVHRDLKPDNIFITPAGRPKVLDFGIAKLQQNVGIGSATQTGSLLGTPHYMSPEQAMGRGVDLRTDIYAIGVILYECATGRRPFHAESLFELLRQHVDVAPVAPHHLRPDLPAVYEQVILRALEKNPDHRWQNTTALIQALQHASHGLPHEAWTPITPGTASAIAAQRTPASWPSGQQSWPAGGHVPSGPGAPPPPATTPGHHLAGPPPPPHPSTDSAGQLVGGAPPPAPSGKGLWIGLAALALIGGGGTAAYLATRGDGTPPTATTTTTAAATAPAADPTAPPTPTADAEPVKQAANPATDEAADPVDQRLEKLDKQLEGALEKLEEVDVDEVKAAAAAAAAARGKTAAAATADAFTSPIPLDLPPGFDPKAFDVSGYFPTAAAEARKIWPDAKLVRIDADGVRPTGLAELTLSDDFYVRYWFRSEKQSKRPADLPIGVEHEATCNLQVWVEPDGIKILPMSWECDEILVPPPKCTFKQAWDKAIKVGAPRGNAVAQMIYTANIVSKKIVWMVDVGDFSEQLPDGC